MLIMDKYTLSIINSLYKDDVCEVINCEFFKKKIQLLGKLTLSRDNYDYYTDNYKKINF